jgi:N-acetylmuramoyl-L-alanine amidase
MQGEEKIMKKVVFDAGHGGPDPGAIGLDGEKESDLAMTYAVDIEEKVYSMAPAEFDIRFTHRGDGATLAKRCEIANDWGADLFVSFHFNAAVNPEAHGYEVFTTRGTTGSDRVATILYRHIADEFGDFFRARADWSDGDPDREANFYVLRNTRMRAVLVEFGFLTNRGDLTRILNPTTEMRFTDAVAKGIVEAT